VKKEEIGHTKGLGGEGKIGIFRRAVWPNNYSTPNRGGGKIQKNKRKDVVQGKTMGVREKHLSDNTAIYG